MSFLNQRRYLPRNFVWLYCLYYKKSSAHLPLNLVKPLSLLLSNLVKLLFYINKPITSLLWAKPPHLWHCHIRFFIMGFFHLLKQNRRLYKVNFFPQNLYFFIQRQNLFLENQIDRDQIDSAIPTTKLRAVVTRDCCSILLSNIFHQQVLKQ